MISIIYELIKKYNLSDETKFNDLSSVLDGINVIAKNGSLGKLDFSGLIKKETLYNNNITSLQEYIQLVEEWILFYNTTRLKSKVKKKRKTYTKREK